MLIPMEDRVLYIPVEEAEKVTGGGILIPGTSREKTLKGKVVAVGPGEAAVLSDCVSRKPMTVQAGDIIALPANHAQTVTVGGSTYGWIRESDIIAVER